MTSDDFKTQVARLMTRFGDKAFDQEFLRLVWAEVSDLSAKDFAFFCDAVIGARLPSRPPLLTDFRELGLQIRNRAFKSDLRQATQALKRAPSEMRRHLQIVLSRDFDGVDSLTDAVERTRAKRRSSFDPEPDGAA